MAGRLAYDALARAERNLALGSESGVVIASAVMAEAILHHVLSTRLVEAAERAREEEAAVRDPGLGHLLGLTRRAEQIAGETVLSDEQRRALNDLNRLRNAVAHAKGGAASVDFTAQRKLLRSVLVPLAESVGALDAAEAVRARREARRPAKRARVDLELDRVAQKSALLHQLSERIEQPLLVLVLDGEKRQGHAAIAELLRAELDRRVRADWVVVGGERGVMWPRIPHLGSRLSKLLEALGNAIGTTEEVPRTDPLLERAAWRDYEDALRRRILALQDLHDGIVVRHRMRPSAGDDAIMTAYLERVWMPAAEEAVDRVSHAALAVSFETERTRPGLWLMPAWWEAFKERRLARRIRGRAPRAASASSIVLPELGRVPRAELVEYLTKRGLDAEGASVRAKELLRLSEGGYFEDLVCEIERTFGEEDMRDPS